jgi:large subunit ribosomal protein L9
VTLVKLILREEIEKLGDAGDVVSVKPGYARNFLLPKGKASIATEARIKELEHHRRIIADKQAKLLKDLDGARAQIESQRIEIEMQAGGEGKLFGSVTLQQVAELLAERGVHVDRRKMHVAAPIKTVGEHEVQVRLHRDLKATLKVHVSASSAPAAAATSASTPASTPEPAPAAPEPDAEAPALDADE